jgi:hypothetical protein
MTIKTFTFLLFAITIGSCKPDDSYNPNYDGDKLVLNGIIEANVGVTVDVSKSQSPRGIIALDGYKVKNPRVWLYQNDSLVGEMKLNAVGKFNTDNFKPQVGKYYRLKAVADNLDTAQSSPVLSLALPNIYSFSLKKDSSYAQNKANAAALLSAIIKDNANENNFYTVTSAVNITKDSTFSFYAGIVSNLTSCEFYGYGSVFGNFFNDGCFNGSDYTFAYVSEHNNKGILTIQLSTIDKNYFNYISTLDQPTGFALAFVEPLITSSNIINGYGIFAAKSTRTFSLKLD